MKSAIHKCCCTGGVNAQKDEDEKHTNIIKDKEAQIRIEFESKMQKEMANIKDKFDFILQNEQIRASYMLCEAHRERQEKINALQTQLECKNLAGLMFVLCSERRKSKLEKLKIVEDYNNYIMKLQEILTEAQNLILNLAQGYKTAARVDQDWQKKMNAMIKEFQAYIYNFCGGAPETNQYFFDTPALLKSATLTVDNTETESCGEECEEKLFEDTKEEDKQWYDRLDSEHRPFVMFGDMADFKPPQRRQVLKCVKAAKTVPKKWKEYVFNEMYLQSDCPNLEDIKEEYTRYLPPPTRLECQAIQTQDLQPSKMSLVGRRTTVQSLDLRGDMGSILKIITNNALGQPVTKATLLGARDSMEIASTTRLRDRHKHDEHSKVVINVGKRRNFPFEEETDEELQENSLDEYENTQYLTLENEETSEVPAVLGSHNDSLQIKTGRVPELDHKINYEKVCPMEKCKRMQVDSFIRSLPPYMQASPFTHFEQTYDAYETCSPEQLETLKQRIAEKKMKDKLESESKEENPLSEWTASVEGVAVQTSMESMSLPPCTCRAPGPTPASSLSGVFDVADLLPIKEALNEINRACFYDSNIQFDRFKVIGQENKEETNKQQKDFKQTRIEGISKILKQYPSLLELFQANARC